MTTMNIRGALGEIPFEVVDSGAPMGERAAADIVIDLHNRITLKHKGERAGRRATEMELRAATEHKEARETRHFSQESEEVKRERAERSKHCFEVLSMVERARQLLGEAQAAYAAGERKKFGALLRASIGFINAVNALELTASKESEIR